jgi:hypothetical protein
MFDPRFPRELHGKMVRDWLMLFGLGFEIGVFVMLLAPHIHVVWK